MVYWSGIQWVEVRKFSSGSFTEGRLAAKAAVKYIEDKKADGVKVIKQYEDLKNNLQTLENPVGEQIMMEQFL